MVSDTEIDKIENSLDINKHHAYFNQNSMISGSLLLTDLEKSKRMAYVKDSVHFT